MHKYKKNRGKFTFSAILVVFGLRGVALASVFLSRYARTNFPTFPTDFTDEHR